MLGNDVVDLLDLDANPDSFSPRFDDRVFSVDERKAIAADANPLARHWAHWAAKEAAYKLAKQFDSTFVFSPRRLVANFAPVRTEWAGRLERHGHLQLPTTVAGGDGPNFPLALRSFETTERIHVIAVPATSDWGAVDHAIEPLDVPHADPSDAVRKLATREISRRLGLAVNRLSIGQDGRIPMLLLDGAETSLSLSLSHHGDWIGYATALRLDRPIETSGSEMLGRRRTAHSVRTLSV